MPGGRPSKYKEEYCEQATKLCLLGATDVQLADFFEVNPDTIYEWKNKHTEFSEALRAGKIVADMEISHSLYNRAKGYDYTEIIPIKLKETFGGGVSKETVQLVEVTKHVPPDPLCIKFWLTNRQPSQWSDKQKELDPEKKQLLPLQIEGEGKQIPIAESEQEISTEKDERYKQ